MYGQQMLSADLLSNSLRQRIGDYDIQINTVPAVPISGHDTRINIRISSVSNIPITDTPIVIRISDGKHELHETQPVFCQVDTTPIITNLTEQYLSCKCGYTR